MTLKFSEFDGAVFDDAEPRFVQTDNPAMAFDRVRSRLVSATAVPSAELGAASAAWMAANTLDEGGGGTKDIALNLISSHSEIDRKHWSFKPVGGTPPYVIDFGDGSEPVEITGMTSHDYAENGEYAVTLTDSADPQGSLEQNARVDDTPFVISVPQDGAALDDAVYDIAGRGAEPGAEVQLWDVAKRDPATGEPNATTTAGAEGLFTFTGEHPAYGAATWAVTSGGRQSPSVSVTAPDKPDEEPVEEPVEEPAEET